MPDTGLENETAIDWTVSGIDCGAYATKIRDAVGRLPGVSGVEVATLSHDDSGHGHLHDDPAERGKSWYQTGKGRLIIFATVLLAAAWIIELLAPEIG